MTTVTGYFFCLGGVTIQRQLVALVVTQWIAPYNEDATDSVVYTKT